MTHISAYLIYGVYIYIQLEMCHNDNTEMGILDFYNGNSSASYLKYVIKWLFLYVLLISVRWDLNI